MAIKNMKTGNKILLFYAVFAIMNVALAWVAFFFYQQVPDTLLTLVLGVGGLVDVMTAAVAITKVWNKSVKKKKEAKE